jgi:hypothetical protein
VNPEVLYSGQPNATWTAVFIAVGIDGMSLKASRPAV